LFAASGAASNFNHLVLLSGERNLAALNLRAESAFNITHHRLVFATHKGKRISRSRRTSGTADAMGIRSNSIWYVEVYDVRNTLHVNTACRDVRGNKHLESTIAKSLHGFCSAAL
jgi:hypothetical protein